MDVSSWYSIHSSYVIFLLGEYNPCHVRIYLLSTFPVQLTSPDPCYMYAPTVYRPSLLYHGDRLHPPSLLTLDRISVVNTSVFTSRRSKIISMFLGILFNSSLSKYLLLACIVFGVGPAQELYICLVHVSSSTVCSELSSVLHRYAVCCPFAIRSYTGEY